MSIKDLFSKGKSNQFQQAQSADSASVDVESHLYVKAKTDDNEQFIPPIDFTTASNFAKYGSVELYYDYAFKRVYQQYPYDGTLAEKKEFENSSSYFDKYIFDNLYPRTNGYAIFSPNGWGDSNPTNNAGYAVPSTLEYIKILGGPHTASNGMDILVTNFSASMLYDADTDYKRGSSLEFNLLSGSAVEFWLKKKEYTTAISGLANAQHEVLFDLWNSSSDSNTNGRLTIGLNGAVSASPWRISIKSGSVSTTLSAIGSSNLTAAKVADDNWHHYAFTFKSASSGVVASLYVDGTYDHKVVIGSQGMNNITGSLMATIGAAVTTPLGASTVGLGCGKLSGSIDEFRFWKVERSAREIGLNWFKQFGGGTNDYKYNKELGVYFKFNEGITGTASTDSKVLDYSGRIANGVWTGYAAAARNTGSAMVLSGKAKKEFKDPIIYSTHPDVSSTVANLKTSGSLYDRVNTSMFYHLLPSWIAEEDSQNGEYLRQLSQIMASYFDTLNAQVEAIRDIKKAQYFSGSHQPAPFADKLLRGRGFVVPELFIEADIIEKFMNKDDNEIYEKEVNEVKNLIYQNIYNNLSYIYNSKGTEKSFRNLFRCFGVDSELIKLNLYADDATYLFRDNYEYKSVPKQFVNFNLPDNFDAVVYQVRNDGSLSYISSSEGEPELHSSFTIEAEVLFPKKLTPQDPGYFNTPFVTSSLFGFHRADITTPTDYTFESSDTTLQVMAIRTGSQGYLWQQESESKDVYFILTGAINGTAFPAIPSSVFKDTYEDNKWNFAIRVKQNKYPYNPEVTGSKDDQSYVLELYGANAYGDNLQNEFTLTKTLTTTQGQKLLTHAKRLYVGAHRTNLTGTILQRCDARLSSIRYWQSYLSDDVMKYHAYDVENHGVTRPYDADNMFQGLSTSTGPHVPQIETLALHWDFNQLSASDSNGKFIVNDISSGSLTTEPTRYGYIGKITQRLYPGEGQFFEADSTDAIVKEFLYSAKKRPPDVVYSSDMITIKDNETEHFFQDDDVSDNFYSFEKSMNAVISEEMLKMFATVVDFNNLIGEPAYRYRDSYREMGNLKRIFFEKVQNAPDPEKFLEYYKWIDSSVSVAIQQLYPASARFSEGIRNIVESHVLERNKYDNKFPLLAPKEATEGSMHGHAELNYNWKFGQAPLTNKQSDNCLWWKDRADRTKALDFASSDDALDTKREEIRTTTERTNNAFPPKLVSGNVVYDGSTYAIRKLTQPYRVTMDLYNTIHGGVNYFINKNREFVFDATRIHGKKHSNGAPLNIFTVGLGSGSGVEDFIDCDDQYIPNEKKNWNFTARKVKNEGAEYSDYSKGILNYPMNLKSGSVTTGYNNRVNDFKSDVIITNLHSDTYMRQHDIGMQGPFTEAWVGGHQHRHAPPNRYVDGTLDTRFGVESPAKAGRPEAWELKISRGTTNADYHITEDSDGAMGFVSADYPPALIPKFGLQKPFAIWFREERAKRPVNIKNIKTTTASRVFGNYSFNYDIIQTCGVAANNMYLRDATTSLLPASLSTALPQTTHVMTLVGQAPGCAGNVFGSHDNNRQPDAELITCREANIEYSKGSFHATGLYPQGLSEGWGNVDGDLLKMSNLNYGNDSEIEIRFENDRKNDGSLNIYPSEVLFRSTLLNPDTEDYESVNNLGWYTEIKNKIQSNLLTDCGVSSYEVNIVPFTASHGTAIGINTYPDTSATRQPHLIGEIGTAEIASTDGTFSISSWIYIRDHELAYGADRNDWPETHYLYSEQRKGLTGSGNLGRGVYLSFSAIEDEYQLVYKVRGEDGGNNDQTRYWKYTISHVANHTRWMHICITHDGTWNDGSGDQLGPNANAKLYINGEQVFWSARLPTSNFTGPMTIYLVDTVYMLNKHSTSAGAIYGWHGRVDDTAVWWGNELTSTQAAAHFNDGIVIAGLSLQSLSPAADHYWNFGDATGDLMTSAVTVDCGQGPQTINTGEGVVKDVSNSSLPMDLKIMSTDGYNDCDIVPYNYVNSATQKFYFVEGMYSSAPYARIEMTASNPGRLYNLQLSEIDTSHTTFFTFDHVDGGKNIGGIAVAAKDIVTKIPNRHGERSEQHTGSDSIFITRFSAPGGVEVNSLSYLDVQASEYSVYNALPFRNLEVRKSGSGESTTIRNNTHANRRFGMQTLLSRHCGQFGIDSVYGNIREEDYNVEPSFNKQHRNNHKKYTGITEKALQVPETNKAPFYVKTSGCGELAVTSNVPYRDWTFSFWLEPYLWADLDMNNLEAIKMMVLKTENQSGETSREIYFSSDVPGGTFQLIVKEYKIDGGSFNWHFDLSRPNDRTLWYGGEWKHWVITNSGINSSDCKLFINGVENYHAVDYTISGVSSSPYVGRRSHGGDWIFFSNSDSAYLADAGCVGLRFNEMSWWKNNLEISKIKELYNNEKYFEVSKHSRNDLLVSWWSCGDHPADKDGPEIWNLMDEQGNHHLSSTLNADNILTQVAGFVDGNFANDRHVFYKVRYDNMYINTPIPRSEFQYSWITASLGKWSPVEQKVLGYSPPEGFYSSSAEGFVLAINFPTASEIFGIN